MANGNGERFTSVEPGCRLCERTGVINRRRLRATKHRGRASALVVRCSDPEGKRPRPGARSHSQGQSWSFPDTRASSRSARSSVLERSGETAASYGFQAGVKHAVASSLLRMRLELPEPEWPGERNRPERSCTDEGFARSLNTPNLRSDVCTFQSSPQGLRGGGSKDPRALSSTQECTARALTNLQINTLWLACEVR